MHNIKRNNLVGFEPSPLGNRLGAIRSYKEPSKFKTLRSH